MRLAPSRGAWASPVFIAFAALAFIPADASAQVLYISAPSNYLVVHATMQLTPELYAPDDVTPIPAKDWVWTSSSPNIASIDSGGNVTGLALGVTQITLQAPGEAGSQFTSIQIEIQPQSMSITPATQNLFVGQSIRFTATATDVKGQPIPNPPVVWFLTTEAGDPSLVPANVTIGSDGTFMGGATGTYTVHADIYYPLEYGQPSHFEALAYAVVALPQTFTISRLITSDPVPTSTLRPSPGFFASGASGTFAFTASPDGLSTSVIGFTGNIPQSLVESGGPSPEPGGVIAGFQEAAVNANGDTLVAVNRGPVADGAILAAPHGKQPNYVVLDNAEGIDQNGNTLYYMTYMHLTPYSFNDSGNALVKALYSPQVNSTANELNGLFLLQNATSPTQTPLLLWNEGQALDSSVPLSGNPPRFTFAEDNTESQPGWMGTRDFGIDNSGNVYFMAQSGSSRGLYMVPFLGTAAQHVLALGDTLLGGKVTSIQDLIVMSSGDLALTAAVQIGTVGSIYIVYFHGGKYSSSLLVFNSPPPRTLAASAAGILFEGVPAAKQAEGLWLWKPGTTAATSVLPLSANVKYISTARIDPSGAVVAVVEDASNRFVLMQPGSPNLFVSGPAIGLSSYIDLRNLVRGSIAALPSVQVALPSSLFTVGASGTLNPRVVVGDPNFSGTDNIVEDPGGSQYYASGGTLFKYSNGSATPLVSAGTKAPDGTLITPNRAYAVNGLGGVVFDATTNATDGHSSLFLLQNGALTLLLRTLSPFGSAQIQSWSEAAVDGSNQTSAIVSLSSGTELLMVFNSKGTSVISSTGSPLGGETVALFDHLRGTPNAFYVRVALTADYTHAAAAMFTGPQTPVVLIQSGATLPDGTTLGDFRLLDANEEGAIVIAGTASITGTQVLLYRPPTGPISFVCANNQQLQTGDYIAAFIDLNLRDNGTVYFLAFDVNDRAIVFQATPLMGPSISPGGIVPLYSTSTVIQPGEFISIYGQNLASSSVVWKGDFPTSLGGTTVSIDGKPAYLIYVSSTLIDLQVPDDAARGTVSVSVTTSVGTGTSTVQMADLSPSFLVQDSKHVTGIILRLNGSGAYGGGTYDILGPTGSSLGYSTVAAKAGDIVELFGVGFGPTTPTVPAGQVLSTNTPAVTTNTVQLSIGGKSVPPSFAGLTEEGLYQLNVTIPPGLGTGDVALAATVGTAQTQPDVVISLQ